MIASLLVLLVGLVDIVRPRRTRGLALAWTVCTLSTVGTLAVLGLGMSPWRVLGCALLTIGWTWVMPTDPARRQRLWPALALLAVVVVMTLAGPSPSGSTGFLLTAYDNMTHPALDSVTPATVLAALAVLAFLTQSANLVTRAAIGLVQDGDTAEAVHGGPSSTTSSAISTLQATSTAGSGSSWDLRIGRRRLASVDRRSVSADAPSPAGPLKGGRLIGPLERYLIVTAGLVGAYPVIAGLLAAKGIVRFPEISADRGVGSAAETFLIGSLTSWTISAAAIIYLLATHTL